MVLLSRLAEQRRKFRQLNTSGLLPVGTSVVHHATSEASPPVSCHEFGIESASCKVVKEMGKSFAGILIQYFWSGRYNLNIAPVWFSFS